VTGVQTCALPISELSNEVLNEPTYKILKSSPRLTFIQNELVQMLHATFTGIVSASRLNDAKPFATEVQFGQIHSTKGWQPLAFDLGNGRTLDIRGKVDRIDTDQVGDKLFVSLIDYKSGNKKFEFRDAYNGIALQLLTYMQAVKLNEARFEQSIDLGGAVFAHIANPKVKLADISKAQLLQNVLGEDGLQAAENAKQQAFGYQGLLLNDENYLLSLDDSVQETGNAQHYGFATKAKGGFKGADLIEVSDLDLLLKHNEKQLIETGKNILDGEFPLAPAKWSDQTTALQYTPFKAIMSFDAMIDNQYNILEKMDRKAVLERLASEAEGGNDNA
jgi:ATP-dependent helicase/nuclease subunit B